MLRDFFKRHQKTDIGSQTKILPKLSLAPSPAAATVVMIYPTTDEEHYNFPPPPEKEKPTILYSDKFCELTKNTLKIFHFPEHPKGATAIKQIQVSDIKKVYYQDQESFWDCCSVAIVGLNRGTLWAFDYSRYTFSCCCSAPPSETNIVINTGKEINFGFTVIDGPVFTSSLKAALNNVNVVEFFEGIP